MYSTCLFCHASLGTNESIEKFPIGKRLAFDAAKGRLWVVCGKCDRWNLSPLDERWEAIDEAERAYRDTRKRVTTDHVGLARLRDGTDLIRIGEPLRPEFAAWRYGSSFVRRCQRELLAGAALGAGAVAAMALGASAYGPGIVGGGAALSLQLFSKRGLFKPGVRLRGNDGTLVRVTGLMVEISSIIRKPNSEYSVNVMRRTEHSNGPLAWLKGRPLQLASAPYLPVRFTGESANRALSTLMATINRFGGGSTQIARALEVVEKRGSSPDLLISKFTSEELAPSRRATKDASIELLLLTELPPHVRLALEMSLHEDSERRALEGELHELEQRWKEAEEIAAISDSLFLAPKGDAASD
ncbi:MAG: hypothetical protein ABI852_00985 [Gemmatimonadaceae bacterium]